MPKHTVATVLGAHKTAQSMTILQTRWFLEPPCLKDPYVYSLLGLYLYLSKLPKWIRVQGSTGMELEEVKGAGV